MGADSSSAGHAPAAAVPDDVDALLDAARYGDMEDVTSLATAGVPLDSRDEQGRTALHMAAANGHLNIVDYLISKGASCSIDLRNPDKFSQVLDVNAANVEKNTPLHWACLNGHVQVVHSLILARANASLLNSHERTPIDEAVSRGKLDVVDAINAAAVQLELNGTSMS